VCSIVKEGVYGSLLHRMDRKIVEINVSKVERKRLRIVLRAY